MNGKFIKRITSVALGVTMLVACIPNAFAITNNTTEPVEKNTDNTNLSSEDYQYELGVVIISLNFNAPSVEWLLQDFEIESTRLLTPGSHTQNVYYVTFVEKTDEIVWKAINVLNDSSYVKIAEPNFYYSVEPDDNLATQPALSAGTNILMGDADGDGRLTIGDATYIQKYLVGLISKQEINYSAANVSKSGKVSIDDSTDIQKKIVGIDSNW